VLSTTEPCRIAQHFAISNLQFRLVSLAGHLLAVR
jgi:hypothetical protein